ncbi:MAG: MoaD/ThiS family protein, partial [Gemmatimonadales bacterium]
PHQVPLRGLRPVVVVADGCQRAERRLLGDEAHLVAAELELAEPATVGDAVKLLRKSVPNGHLLPERPLVAVNLEHVLVETSLREGDELALLPPLAGG